MHFYITAPSSCVDAEDILRAQHYLEQQGHQVSLAKHIFAQHRYLAGQVSQRLADLYTAWADPSVDAIWCARGGTGAAQLLPALAAQSIDWPTLKPMIGYSDSTALLNFLARRGAAALHGPVFQEIASKNQHDVQCISSDAETVLQAIAQPSQQQTFPLAALNQAARHHQEQQHSAVLQLWGGNLTVLCSLQGTPHALSLQQDSVLLLEDVGEAFYRVERSFTQLLQSIDRQHLKAVVMGDFYQCPQKNVPDTLAQIFAEHLDMLNIPLYQCSRFGHGPQNQAFWLGKMAQLKPSTLLIGAVH